MFSTPPAGGPFLYKKSIFYTNFPEKSISFTQNALKKYFRLWRKKVKMSWNYAKHATSAKHPIPEPGGCCTIIAARAIFAVAGRHTCAEPSRCGVKSENAPNRIPLPLPPCGPKRVDFDSAKVIGSQKMLRVAADSTLADGQVRRKHFPERVKKAPQRAKCRATLW